MISNTSPIIFLAKINNLDLLKKLYGNVFITNDVKEELLEHGRPDTELIRICIEKGILLIKNPTKRLELGLGKGENSAISLARELADSLLIDDLQATRAAQALSIKTLRTTTIIFSALSKKIITKETALDMISQIIDEGYFIAPRYYKEIFDKLKE